MSGAPADNLVRLPSQSMDVPPEDPPPPPPPPEDEDSRPAPGGPVALGHDRGSFFYLSQGTGQVHALTAGQHTKLNLLAIASGAHYWQRTRFMGKRDVAWDEAADWLMESCRQRGVFDPERIRGRGAWWDEGRAVLHLGDRLLVDGVPTEIRDHDSRFIYEVARPIEAAVGKPLSAAEAKRFAELCDLAAWDQSDMALLFAGWCVIAPVCGAMPWRPHLWLVSESGAGKTWLVDNLLRPVVGGLALRAQSKSTEAGIRQDLGSDARPVIFDEAETQNQRDRERMQTVLDLARQASSEGGAAILKGSTTGQVKRYLIRSMFSFTSINLGLEQAADESRTIVLSLVGPRPDEDDEARQARAERFQALQRAVTDLLTPDYCAGLLARTLGLLGTIRANAEVFARAAAEKFGSRRQGDTLGAVLAGVWSLHSARALTIEQAREFIETRSWVTTAARRTETVPDHERALHRLLEHVIPVQTQSGSRVDRSIGELIDAWVNKRDQGAVNEVADQHLLRAGIKIEMGTVWVARSHSRIDAIYRDTPWAASWPTTLLRLNGAASSDRRALRFGPVVKKAVGLPVGLVIAKEDG